MEDAFRSREQLIAENAVLRQQLVVAARAVAQPRFKADERGLMLLFASLARHWRSAVLLVQPETVLRWHRHGFRLFWRWKSRHLRTVAPRVSRATPSSIWVALQLRNATAFGIGPRFIIRDHDDKYGRDCDRAAKGVGTRVLKTPVRAPKADAFCEPFLASVRRECLDHVFVLGERHLLGVLAEYCRYFDRARTHQGIGQLVPAGSSTAAAGSGAVIATPVLNGLHHDYRRAA